MKNDTAIEQMIDERIAAALKALYDSARNNRSGYVHIGDVERVLGNLTRSRRA